jgi:hypothetical protein
MKETIETHVNLKIHNKNIKNYKMIFPILLLDLRNKFHSTKIDMS